MIVSVLSVFLTLWFPACILCVGGDFYSNLPLPRERLFCDGDLPDGTYGDGDRSWQIREGLDLVACGEWEVWSRLNFTDISDLCTIHGNPEGNFGGFCIWSSTTRQPVYDVRLAEVVLLYDRRIADYCERHCFCPTTEDQYLATDLREAARFQELVRLADEQNGPLPRPPSAIPHLPERPGEWMSAARARRVVHVGRLRAYRGRAFQCMGVQGRGTSGMLSCYCGLRRLGAQLRTVSFFLGG
ncbi:hypothetical protein MMC34_006138 [Xylographa carneopallida]|nr:hypothetical protein [Xylographa carneopallida]